MKKFIVIFLGIVFGLTASATFNNYDSGYEVDAVSQDWGSECPYKNNLSKKDGSEKSGTDAICPYKHSIKSKLDEKQQQLREKREEMIYNMNKKRAAAIIKFT